MLRHKNYLSLREAEEQGFGTTDAIRHQILRGAVLAEKVGNVWVVTLPELRRMVHRRIKWRKSYGKL